MNKRLLFSALFISLSFLVACGQGEDVEKEDSKKVDETVSTSKYDEGNVSSGNSENDRKVDENSLEVNGSTEGDSKTEEDAASEETPNDEEENVDSSDRYDLTKEQFTENGVSINYPQITGLTDSEKQKALNDLLYNEAYKVLNFYDGSEGLDLEIDYLISYKSDYFLSVQYAGSGYVEGAAHPNNLFYTTNVDVENGERIRLSDVVVIDESFLSLFQSETFKVVHSDQAAFANDLKANVTIDQLRNADNLDGIGTEVHSETFTYFTDEGIGISIGTSHAAGGHAAFEMMYVESPDEIWAGDKMWDLLKIYQ
ncbi:hypothetical protein [Guptibacillus hwajinpoensis]|uniref:DUF4163 domain-containing protein n=1 Tax=Guptibacillus hwajinpoensis TaxID=208199 RepID=A0ABU0K0X9_9BACL|nr:hypothetical protein [Alkalihalobacillus hemicentroti]MDQ0483000.1 hypothetical protein [Alkalihalobacillus hemicentroti]